jgi:RsmE family RNA methyltransferase
VSRKSSHPAKHEPFRSACPNEKIAVRPNVSNENDLPLLAIGSEGGWTDEEVAMMEAHGFQKMSLGPRILRTDTATIALLSLLDNMSHP